MLRIEEKRGMVMVCEEAERGGRGFDVDEADLRRSMSGELELTSRSRNREILS